jgi:UDP-GlcNAc:undecaprenyl-phosphate GlcNAc-1-phosphate transferase
METGITREALLGPFAMLPLAAALALSLVLTPLVRRAAIAVGMVAQPKRDRWHRKPTALLGGVAIALTVAIAWLLFPDLMPHHAHGRIVLGASLFLCVVGFIDDVWHIKPYQKLIGQVLGATIILYAGLSLPWTAWASVNVAITFFWLVGITNAVNLLDNMDGLAAGVSAVAAIFLAIGFVLSGKPTEAVMLGVFAAALVGFLIFNSNPASIFMGDCGSMFIGFFLASAALLTNSGTPSRSFVVVIAVPVLVLFIPIFDTTLVTVVRKLAGRAASQGGRDHTSHRLVALGLSERRAVWLLYGLSVMSGMLAVVAKHQDIGASLPLIALFTIGLALLGVYLAGVKVYGEAEIQAARERPLVAFFVGLSYKRRVFEVLLDLVFVILSYYLARTLLRGPMTQPVEWERFIRTVSVLVFVQMVALLASGSYRGIWRYVSIDNVVVYARAVVAGTVASYGILLAVGIDRMQPAVFVLDAMILFLLLTSSRLTFRLFRRLLPVAQTAGTRRVMIYGAGDGGELLLREVLYNRDLHLTPVGFVDDDPLKVGKVIHGLRVYSGYQDLLGICRERRVDEVLISSLRIPDARLAEIWQLCSAAGINVRRMRIQLEDITTPEAGVLHVVLHDDRVPDQRAAI